MKFATRVTLVCALTAFSAASIVRAQVSEPKRFTVPFMFEVGKHVMPAGTYMLRPLSDFSTAAFTLSEVKSTRTVIVTAEAFDKKAPRELNDDTVVFEPGENHLVLCQVWDAASGSAIQMTGTAPLVQAAKERERGKPNVEVTVKMERIKK